MLYFIIFIILALLGVFDFVKINKIAKVALYIFILSSFVFLGTIRWKTGTDWNDYLFFFKSNDSWESYNRGAFETGYVILNYLIKQISDNYTVFLFFLSFLVITIKGYAFTRYSDSLLVLALLYFCFLLGDIFSVRQQIAVSLCFVATLFIINKKPIWFLLTVFLAFHFHNSVVLFLFAYWIFHLKLSNKMLIVLISGAILLGVSGIFDPILNLLNIILGGFEGGTASRMADKVSFYTQNKDLANDAGKGATLLIGVIRRCIFIPVYLLFRKKCEAKNANYKGFLNLFIFGNIVYFIFGTTLLVMVRATIYFIVFEMLMLVILLGSFDSKKIKIAVYLVVVAYCGLKLYINLNSYWDLFVPFYSIFDTSIPRVIY